MTAALCTGQSADPQSSVPQVEAKGGQGERRGREKFPTMKEVKNRIHLRDRLTCVGMVNGQPKDKLPGLGLPNPYSATNVYQIPAGSDAMMPQVKEESILINSSVFQLRDF